MKKVLLSAIAVITLLAFKATDADTYTIDTSKSTVAWLAKKVTGQHNGEIKIKEGKLNVEGGKLVGGAFTLDMTTINCLDIEDAKYNAKLVGHLKNDDFFSVDKHSTSTFKITKAVLKKSADGNYEITGDLTIKGKTSAITFPANVTITEGAATATATAIFDRSKFDIKYGSSSFFDNLGDKTIYDDVEMTIELSTKL